MITLLGCPGAQIELHLGSVPIIFDLQSEYLFPKSVNPFFSFSFISLFFNGVLSSSFLWEFWLTYFYITFFKLWLGINFFYGSFVIVNGSKSCPYENQFSIDFRSYVCPLDVITGSFIISILIGQIYSGGQSSVINFLQMYFKRFNY